MTRTAAIDSHTLDVGELLFHHRELWLHREHAIQLDLDNIDSRDELGKRLAWHFEELGMLRFVLKLDRRVVQ